MALLARTRSRDRRVPGNGTLLARCLAAGLPVASSCSGRGACGRCALAILEGSAALTPPSPREARVLARNGLSGSLRLACQCRVRQGRATVTVQAAYW